MEKYAGYNVPKWKDYPCCGDMHRHGCPFTCDGCLFQLTGCDVDKIKAYHDYVEFHDLTKNRVRFDLLPIYVQEMFKKTWNGLLGLQSNIQKRVGYSGWEYKESAEWFGYETYRLDPNWKPDQVKKVSKEEVFKILKEKFNCKEVEIVE